VLLDYSITDSPPQRAQAVAAEVAQQFTVLVAELEAPQGEASPVRVSVAKPPNVPDEPSAPYSP
jgi:hypothetical protein